MESREIDQVALERARTGLSLLNYQAIYDGFGAKGISQNDIKPRGNVLTFNAWRALGRVVMRGQHGVKVLSFVPMSRTDKDTGATVQMGRRPRAVTVFHVSQTQAIGGGVKAVQS